MIGYHNTSYEGVPRGRGADTRQTLHPQRTRRAMAFDAVNRLCRGKRGQEPIISDAPLFLPYMNSFRNS